MSDLRYQPEPLHWAEKLQTGDRVTATIRHPTDGSLNRHEVDVIVIGNHILEERIIGWLKDGTKKSILYNELEIKIGKLS